MTRNELLSCVMNGICLPLICAIIETSSGKDETHITQEITALLTETIKNSNTISATLNIEATMLESIDFRLNMAALSSKIIAAHYAQTKTVPAQHDLKTSHAAIKAILVFSENYLPAERLTELYPENNKTQKTAPHHKTEFDYLETCIPLINTVATFAFGQTETKMIQNISEKLRARATEIRSDLLDDIMSDEEKKETELSILKSLIKLYTDCHQQEMQRIMSLSNTAREQEKSAQHIKNIWALFEKRATLLNNLAHEIMPDQENDLQLEEQDILTTLPERAENEEKFKPMAFYKKSDA